MGRAATVVAAVLAAVGASCAGEPVELTVAPSGGKPVELGQLVDMDFTVTNRSSNAIVVGRIEAATRAGAEPVVLSSSAYGSIEKTEDGNGYIHGRMNQTQTDLAMHGGFLLPGEQVTVTMKYRLVAKEEVFEVAYWAADGAYDGTPESLQPFCVYVPKPEESEYPLAADYVPFTEDGWRAVAAANPAIRPLGAEAPPRAVLVPDLEGAPEKVVCRVRPKYEGTPFYLGQARKAASRIVGKGGDKLEIAYCGALGGYVVLERDCSWLISSASQKERGILLAPFPPVLTWDLDLATMVIVRVGDKQEGFGPGNEEEPHRSWEGFPVFYGDGMYTQGEFIHLERDRALEFLEVLHGKGMKMGAVSYFFRARYYTVG